MDLGSTLTLVIFFSVWILFGSKALRTNSFNMVC